MTADKLVAISSFIEKIRWLGHLKSGYKTTVSILREHKDVGHKMDDIDRAFLALGLPPLNIPELPDWAYLAVSIKDFYAPNQDFIGVIAGSEQVWVAVDKHKSYSAHSLGLVPAIPRWNDGEFFTKRVAGIVIWQGYMSRPQDGCIWRRPSEKELLVLRNGVPLDCNCVECRAVLQRFQKDTIELSTYYKEKAETFLKADETTKV